MGWRAGRLAAESGVLGRSGFAVHDPRSILPQDVEGRSGRRQGEARTARALSELAELAVVEGRPTRSVLVPIARVEGMGDVDDGRVGSCVGDRDGVGAGAGVAVGVGVGVGGCGGMGLGGMERERMRRRGSGGLRMTVYGECDRASEVEKHADHAEQAAQGVGPPIRPALDGGADSSTSRRHASHALPPLRLLRHLRAPSSRGRSGRRAATGRGRFRPTRSPTPSIHSPSVLLDPPVSGNRMTRRRVRDRPVRSGRSTGSRGRIGPDRGSVGTRSGRSARRDQSARSAQAKEPGLRSPRRREPHAVPAKRAGGADDADDETSMDRRNLGSREREVKELER